ncbi:hypothetical protein DFH08DRAFT_808338 [Mycena albidolilacea]|uniref:Uncharacterized protein n=1 Tax=Mycena albidolilacea TaxID=1033008 RepID=A0AAD7A343_9AGAR|nr:hypothetical protein DFH08DRAFT_808338 [Mycena albidolilacea]
MFSKRRYNPYSTLSRPPAPSPQTKELLKEASEQLEFYNQAGVMVTWVGNDWEIVSRPTRKTANSMIPVGAASLPSVPNFIYPSCPHLDYRGRPYAPMKLQLGKQFRGIKEDFFRAGDHQCSGSPGSVQGSNGFGRPNRILLMATALSGSMRRAEGREARPERRGGRLERREPATLPRGFTFGAKIGAKGRGVEDWGPERGCSSSTLWTKTIWEPSLSEPSGF